LCTTIVHKVLTLFTDFIWLCQIPQPLLGTEIPYAPIVISVMSFPILGFLEGGGSNGFKN